MNDFVLCRASSKRPRGTVRVFWGVALAMSLVAAWGLRAQPVQAAQTDDTIKRPNVVLFMADDMGMGDTSAYQDLTGNTDEQQIATPAMERLAAMGVRCSDAHTPSSRCTSTRYGLLTGRYPWRTRLKHFVLFGSQGDPLIESDRPTLATLFRQRDYSTAITGKWHLGLLYRRSDGTPADDWHDADLTQPIADGPLDHGFDFARFTSRSHGTSGPIAARGKGRGKRGGKRGDEEQVGGGPGHIDGRRCVGAIGPKSFVESGLDAYILKELGSRHFDDAIEFLDSHVGQGPHAGKPFFLYYPSNSNHTPHTPDAQIDSVAVAGASKTKAGTPGNKRMDFVYENDVALGRLMHWLASHDDPRQPGATMLQTTVVIFTSDNGSEDSSKSSTGPVRSNKGSCFEGGHRVPLIVSWAHGGIGDGDPQTPGATSSVPVSLVDLYATFSEILSLPLPSLIDGAKGAEDSRSALSQWRDASNASHRAVASSDSANSDSAKPVTGTPWPLFFNDHKEAKSFALGASDPAALAMRYDDPSVDGSTVSGQWKVFFDSSLIRRGTARAVELYELRSDPMERNNRMDDPALKPLISQLSKLAVVHRVAGGHRWAALASGTGQRIALSWDQKSDVTQGVVKYDSQGVQLTIRAQHDRPLQALPNGLGVDGHQSKRVDGGEAILISANRDLLIESIELIAGKDGVCGGFYQLGDGAASPVYCVDADDEKYTDTDHSGMMGDIGLLKAGTVLRIDSSPHYGVNATGQWTLKAINALVMP